MAPAPLESSVAARAYDRANAGRWSLDRAAFDRALLASIAHATADCAGLDVTTYVDGLHLEDLALATACAEGDESAWDHFVREFRPALYRAADAVDPSGGARELADALYADLYGLGVGHGGRRSLLRHFHGRSRLSTWLRAVLAQRYVDVIRARRRFEPMPESPEADPAPGLDPSGLRESERPRFLRLIEAVLVAALATLAPRDRLRLSLYYARDLTLAQIGRLLHEHEGTVSRHLTRIRQELRTAMETRLRDEHGLDQAAIDECFQAAIEDAGPLDLRRLLDDREETGKKLAPDRSS